MQERATTFADLEGLISSEISLALAAVEISSGRLVTANAAFADLLNLSGPAEPGLDLLALVPPDELALVQTVLTAVSAGRIELCRGRGHLRLQDRPDVPVIGWIGRLGAGAADDLALVAVMPAESASPTASTPMWSIDGRMVFVTVDHQWRFEYLSLNAGEVFGWGPRSRGAHLLSCVHHQDIPDFLLAIGRSSAGRRSAGTHVRVQHGSGQWLQVRCEVDALCSHRPCRLAVVLQPIADDLTRDDGQDRVMQLEGLIRRLIAEARSAGIGADEVPRPAPADHEPRPELVPGGPAAREIELLGLAAREIELLELAALGLTNRAIAERLILSENTVRSQFQKVLTKLGAHSKLEAVAIARRLEIID